MTSLETILIGNSEPMRQLRAQIESFGPTRLPALIQGPTGSGKELVARALHVASRRTGALVAFNVCAFSETMFEDALFGHVRGAFTGATADRLGYLAEANGGTVFLDEIGGTEPSAQSKLLRAIDTGAFRAVGAAMDRVSDFRVVAATNEPLEGLVERGRFRRDLMHRLAGVVLEVPPLSQRLDDVPLLAEHFLRAIRPAGAASLNAVVARRLCEHTWPGNVRELKHAVERLAVLAGTGTIGREHVDHSIAGENRRLRLDQSRREELERARLVRALAESSWDTTVVAARLGVHRATVYRRIRQYGITSGEQIRETLEPAPQLPSAAIN